MITPEEEKIAEDMAKRREAYDLRVLVVGGGFAYIKMFFDAGFKGAKNIDDADIICFTGGEDVDPAMYEEEAIPGTFFNPDRDCKEAIVFAEAALKKIPMIGICRGAQFLNVMNGGKLWQDVNNHTGRKHDVIDFRTGETISNMTSTHHQQMREGPDAHIIAVAELSTYKKSMNEVVEREEPETDDIEVLWYPDKLSLCFQPHPEMAQAQGCRKYFLDLVDTYIIPAACERKGK